MEIFNKNLLQYLNVIINYNYIVDDTICALINPWNKADSISTEASFNVLLIDKQIS